MAEAARAATLSLALSHGIMGEGTGAILECEHHNDSRGRTSSTCYAISSRLLKKDFSPPAPSLLSLPKGEKSKESSQFRCRVLRAVIKLGRPGFSTLCQD